MTIDVTPLVKIKHDEEYDRNEAMYQFYVNFRGTKADAIEVLRDRYPNKKTGRPMTVRRVQQIIAHQKNKFYKESK